MPHTDYQSIRIFNSGSEEQNSQGLHLNPTSWTSDGLIIPLRYRFVKEDPVFHDVTDKSPVFQDVILLPKEYDDLLNKIRRNLYCRLDKKHPKQPRWFTPWRRKPKFDIGFRLFITYQLGMADIFNTNEVNMANWADMRALFYYRNPVKACFHVDWWFKGAGEICENVYFETLDKSDLQWNGWG